MRIVKVLAALIAGAVLSVSAVQAKVNVRIDLSNQRMHVTNSKGENFSWAISSGRAGFNTPRGSYRPYLLKRMHYSSKYHNSPMPHSIFFRGGYAIHGTGAVGRLGRTASHGCVRLAPGNAAKLFAMVKREGATISITGTPRHSMVASGKSKNKVAKAKLKKKKSYIAKKGGKNKYAKIKSAKSKFAKVKQTSANSLAFAPVRRAPSPVNTWQLNPFAR